MDIGTSIALSATILGIVAVIFKIFDANKEKAKRQERDRDRHHDNICPSHSGVMMSINNMTAWLDKIEKKLDRVIERRETPRDEGKKNAEN